MRFQQHSPTPEQINPALKVAALEAARLVSLAHALDDVADLTRLRPDAPLVEALMRLRDALRAEAANTMKDYISKEETK